MQHPLRVLLKFGMSFVYEFGINVDLHVPSSVMQLKEHGRVGAEEILGPVNALDGGDKPFLVAQGNEVLLGL